MNPALINTATVAAFFLTLFGSAEFLYRRLNLQVEVSRKFVHILGGLIALSFPILFESHWWILLLASSFGIVLWGSKKWGYLRSIHGIDRPSQGGWLYPIAVYGCFVLYDLMEAQIWFYLPVLIMVLADPAAALVGKRWPRGKYRIGDETKTLMGSLAFWVVAFSVSMILTPMMTTWSGLFCLGFSINLAFLTTLTEAISRRGIDNVTVPLAALLLLALI